MKKKLLLISTITFFSMINCQEKKTTSDQNPNDDNVTEIKKMGNIEIKNILIKQLETGASSEYWVGIYGKEDLDALVFIEDTILKNNGYKIPDTEIFNKKIEDIFERIIDNKSETSYLKIAKDDKCDKSIDYQPVYTGLDYVYIDKKQRFITIFHSLPSIIDYQKLYPDISIYEEKPSTITDVDGEVEITRWKDLKNLSKQRRFNKQLLISRNKYLFNNDKSQFVWLTYNDESFMKSLVTNFGYTEDKKLLDWVMEKNHSKPERIVEEVIFVKDCQGKLEIREDILKYIEETTTNEEKTYAEVVLHYVGNLLEDRNNGKTEYTKEELYKITAYAANTIDYLSMKYRTIGMQSSARWNILGGYYYSHSEEKWNKMISVFKTNNYYNLPHLKEVINYAMQFDSVGAPN